ncbi:hypothetical protein O6H91_09G046500 [Diphasiastrum complanatum]|uniref:Uncharacterized protein n=1 Tax=Diphasiastrum complanatum TaxID=34168 RepID=A0ACC2CNP1_DIPCM|nr:hypothetical protein O6H91_09G046500 [Diphasiastrum complanatum]
MSSHAIISCTLTNFIPVAAISSEECHQQQQQQQHSYGFYFQQQNNKCLGLRASSSSRHGSSRHGNNNWFMHSQSWAAGLGVVQGNDVVLDCGGFCKTSKEVGKCSVLTIRGQSLEKEEARWLREEQRWLREEQRWLREEGRWNAERKIWAEHSASLKQEIQFLRQELGDRLQSKAMEEATLRELIAGLRGLLQSLNTPIIHDTKDSKEVRIAASGIETVETERFVDSTDTFASAFVKSTSRKGDTLGTGQVPRGDGSLPKQHVAGGEANATSKLSSNVKQRTLKRGSEGDDVKELQDALAILGFFSGDDDMEFSTFSSGTESAVKSWQASVGVSEDGLVTAERLAQLLNRPQAPPASANKKTEPKKAFKVSVEGPSTAAVSAKKQRDNAELLSSHSKKENVNQRRVYLLGENRWEDPELLLTKSINSTGIKSVVFEKCFSCRGEGQTLCTECEGTGELNVEEEFLDWVDEGAKCPYCEGSGSLKCDLCNGKGR